MKAGGVTYSWGSRRDLTVECLQGWVGFHIGKKKEKWKVHESAVWSRKEQDVYGAWQIAWLGRMTGLKEIMLDESVRQV